MVIDIPVTIIFDCKATTRTNPSRLSRTFTLRYDTADEGAPASFTAGDPQNPKTGWSVDTDGVFFGLMPYRCETILSEKAEQYPVDYCADLAEGERLEAERAAKESV